MSELKPIEWIIVASDTPIKPYEPIRVEHSVNGVVYTDYEDYEAELNRRRDLDPTDIHYFVWELGKSYPIGYGYGVHLRESAVHLKNILNTMHKDLKRRDDENPHVYRRDIEMVTSALEVLGSINYFEDIYMEQNT